MDSFADPPNARQRADLGLSLDDVNEQVRQLEEEYRKKDIPLSGRVLHVIHYLPITAQLAAGQKQGVLSPPLTPPIRATDVDGGEQQKPSEERKDGSDKWILSSRWGHSAMVSGILSLAEHHEQVVVGWTGDIESASTPNLSASISSLAESSSPTTKVKVPVASLSEEDRSDLEAAIATFQSEDHESHRTSYVPVWLPDKVAHGHYEGYCKQTLWPLFHYLLWQDVASENAGSDEAHWRAYVDACQLYAEAVARVYKPGDLIWVHDYHLLLVPQILRHLIPDAVTGLFVHTPFPSSEVFRCLPRRREVLDGMLGANLVCFQTYAYARHFSSSCIRVCGYETAAKGIDNQGHVTTVSYTPVGVDAERIAKDV